MKLEFLSKSLDYLQGEPYQTRVVLGNAEGASYPVFFDAEHISKSNAELFELALEAIYQKNFPHRAEKEKFEELDKAIHQAQTTTAANEEMLKVISGTLTEFIYLLDEAGLLEANETTNQD